MLKTKNPVECRVGWLGQAVRKNVLLRCRWTEMIWQLSKIGFTWPDTRKIWYLYINCCFEWWRYW